MSDETSQPVDENSKKTREAAEESKALNTLTDHVNTPHLNRLDHALTFAHAVIQSLVLQKQTRMQVEEKELDTAKVSKAMTEINASQIAAREAQRQR